MIDGDGLILLVDERRVNRRLADIDAPEQRQPYGIGSRQSLSAICGGLDRAGKPKWQRPQRAFDRTGYLRWNR